MIETGHKIRQSLGGFSVPQYFLKSKGHPSMLVNLWGNSPASLMRPSSKDVDFWLTLLYISYHSLLSFSWSFWCSLYVRSSWYIHSLILHTWTYVSIPIVLTSLWYFVEWIKVRAEEAMEMRIVHKEAHDFLDGGCHAPRVWVNKEEVGVYCNTPFSQHKKNS